MLTDKVKDMVRSILPSTRRRSAKEDKANSVRRNRRQIKQACHDAVLEYYAEKEEDADFENKNATDYKIFESDFEKSEDTKNAVSNRRNGDKINHFVRWAKALTKNFDESDAEGKYYAVAAKIGGVKNLIKEHALSHFISKWQFNNTWYHRRELPKDKELISKEFFAKILQEAFELDHRGFNKILKKVTLNCYNHNLPCHTKQNVNREYYIYEKIFERDKEGNPLRKYKVTCSHKQTSPDYIFQSKYSITSVENIHDQSKCPNYAWIKGPQDMPKLIERLLRYPITEYSLTHNYGDYDILEILHFLKQKNLLDIELPPKKKYF